MTAPTLQLTQVLSDTLGDVLDSARDWTPEGVEDVIDAIALLRRFVAKMRRVAEVVLSRGVEARRFVADFEAAIPLLDRCLAGHARLEERGALAAAPAGVASEFGAARREMAACRAFLDDALTKAKAPPGTIDWAKVKRARDAYAQGETMPVQEVAEAHQGER